MKRYKKIVGRFGENLAKNFLKKRGYRIIAENKKLGSPEIDLVAEKEKEIIFVEVKTRTSLELGPADEALKLSQIKTLKRAIGAYCSQNKINPEKIRLDFISIDINRAEKTAKIKHYKDIF